MAALGAMLLLAGCYHEMHEMRPSEYGEDVPVGYIAPELLYAPEDGLEIPDGDVIFAVAGAGISFSNSAEDVEQASDWLQQLPVGEYDLLVTVGMTEENGYVLSGLPATKAEISLPSVNVMLKSIYESAMEALYGNAHARVDEGGITIVPFDLKRLLAIFDVIVTGVPAGTKIELSVKPVAESVCLTEKDKDGEFGQPGNALPEPVPLGALVADAAGTMSLTDCRIFPTAGGYERSMLVFTVTLPDGKVLTCVGDAPRMDCGKHYTLNLEYSAFQAYMYLTSYPIGPWEDGWTISGEILNPED